ncbi:hypothetical protein TcasGA2_TC007596 [Tribolium castaneum]|uniref:Uncharacterized protein n=1 Tax=Tribolium castaneum TaxID=7070 RepID=D2A300_TRICA|nr:hypothetical protein TcasGA2_TC007596 [Tribolium castaneum]
MATSGPTPLNTSFKSGRDSQTDNGHGAFNKRDRIEDGDHIFDEKTKKTQNGTRNDALI